ERCHAIIYIAYGRIVTEGTVTDVIHHAGLTTWSVRGSSLSSLMHELENNPAITTVAAFGDSLHISGTDAQKLDQALAPFKERAGLTWHQSPPDLEDAFIHFMARSQEQEGAA
ncbi:MAG: ABC transporter ATP-binding protein, partial [Bdellovibrionales bacterium]